MKKEPGPGLKGEAETLLDLAINGLLFTGQAQQDGEQVRSSSRARKAEFIQGRFEKIAPAVKDPQVLLGAIRLGRSLARYEWNKARQGGKQAGESDLRNAPTVINAALYDRLFHDGRSASVFNGYDHLGDEAGQDGFGKWQWRNNAWRRVLIRVADAALASQATAPLLSAQEMSWFGRQYHHVARKLLDRKALAHQAISPTDSHLAGYTTGTQRLNRTYRELIQEAFHAEWWCGGQVPDVRERDAVTGAAGTDSDGSQLLNVLGLGTDVLPERANLRSERIR